MKTSKKPGVAERSHYMQDLDSLHCTSPTELGRAKGNSQQKTRDVCPRGSEKRGVSPRSLKFLCFGVPPVCNQQSERCVI